MKISTIIQGILLFILIGFSACVEPDDNPDLAKRSGYADVTLQVGQQSTGYFSFTKFFAQSQAKISQINDDTKTVLIVAVFERTPFTDDYNSLTPILDQNLLNLSNSTVKLGLVTNKSLRLFEYTFNQNYTLEQLLSSPRLVISSADLGSFTITAETENLSFSPQLKLAATPITLEITPIFSDLNINEKQLFEIIGTFGDGSTQNLTPLVNLSLTRSGIVTLSQEDSSQIATTGKVKGSTTLLIQANGLSKTLFIYVENGFSPVLSTMGALSLDEDTTSGSLPFSFSDEDSGADDLSLIIASSNTTLLPTDNIQISGSGLNRELVITPAANESGQSDITLQVTDEKSNTTSTTFTLSVVAVNDSPSITAIANQQIEEDASLDSLPFTIDDQETAPDSMTLSATSSNPALIQSSGISFSGTGNNRFVSITPLSGQSGVTNITLSVSDGTTSVDTSFTLTVQAVNDPPTISAVEDQTIVQDTSSNSIAFTLSDKETAVSSLIISATSSDQTLVSDNNLLISGTGNSRTLIITPLSGQTGVTTITLQVDDGAAIATSIFTATVVGTSTPVISGIADQSITKNSNSNIIPFTVSDGDTPLSSLTFTVTSSNQGLVPNSNLIVGGSGNNRTLSITPVAELTGSAVITLNVNDGSNSSSTSFNLSVNQSTGATAPTVNSAQYVANGLLTPNGGESWSFGTTVNITWQSSSLAGSNVSLFFLLDNPNGLETTDPASLAQTVNNKNWIARSETSQVPNTGTLTIDPTQLGLSSSFMRTLIIDDLGNWDISDNEFTISLNLLSGNEQIGGLTAPNGAELWRHGNNENVLWNSANFATRASVFLLVHTEIDFTTLSGTALSNAVNTQIWFRMHDVFDLDNTGSFIIDPIDFEGGIKYRILVMDEQGAWDISDAVFSIAQFDLDEAKLQPTALENPTPGARWKDGIAENIQWDFTQFSGSTISLYLMNEDSFDLDGISDTLLTSRVETKPWEPVPGQQNISNSGVLSIDPLSLKTEGSRFRMMIIDDLGNWDISDGDFAINDISQISVDASNFDIAILTDPNTGPTWVHGSQQLIRWDTSKVTDPLTLYYLTDSPSGLNTVSPTDLANVVNQKNWQPIQSGINLSGNSQLLISPEDLGLTGNSIHFLLIDSLGNWDITDLPVNIVFNFSGSYLSSGLTSPNGGETWSQGTQQTIQWNTGLFSGSNIRIYQLHDGTSGLEVSDETSLINNIKQKTWGSLNQGNIPTSLGALTINTDELSSGSQRFFIQDSDGNWDISDADFTVPTVDVQSSLLQATGLTAPNGGENWVDGNTETISWNTSSINGTTITPYLLEDDPSGLELTDPAQLTQQVISKRWTPIPGFGNSSNSGSLSLDPFSLNQQQSGFRILILDNLGNWDISDANFSINDFSQVSVEETNLRATALTSPVSSTVWNIGISETVTWSSDISNIDGSSITLYILEDDPSGFDGATPTELTSLVSTRRWRVIDTSIGITNTGSFSFDPQSLDFSGDIRLLIVDDAGKWDTSDQFSLEFALQSSALITGTLTTPAPATIWAPNSSENISWVSGNFGTTVTLYLLSFDSNGLDETDPSILTPTVNSKSWRVINEARDITNTGSFTVNTNQIQGGGELRILIVDDAGNWDISAGDFSRASVQLAEGNYQGSAMTSPAGGETWSSGTTQTISWDDSTGLTGSNITIYLLDDDYTLIDETTVNILTNSVNQLNWQIFSGLENIVNTGNANLNTNDIFFSPGRIFRVLIVDNLGNWDLSDQTLTFQ